MKRFGKQLGLKKRAWKKFLGDGCPGCVLEYEAFCWGEGVPLQALLLCVSGPLGPSGLSGKGRPTKKKKNKLLQQVWSVVGGGERVN